MSQAVATGVSTQGLDPVGDKFKELIDYLSDPGCGIESETVDSFLLSNPLVANKVKCGLSGEQRSELLKALIAGANPMMEIYAARPIIDVLNLEPIAAAVRESLGLPQCDSDVKELLSTCFSIALTPDGYADWPEDVLKYGNLMRKWLDVVSPQQVVEQAIDDMDDELLEFGEDPADYHEQIFNDLVTLLIDFTSRRFVSGVIHEKYGVGDEVNPGYTALVERGLIDDGVRLDALERHPNKTDVKTLDLSRLTRSQRAIRHYFITDLGEGSIAILEKGLGVDGPVLLALQMAEAAARGQFSHIFPLLSHSNKLFNPEVLAEALTEVAKGTENTRVRTLLQSLPDGIIDWREVTWRSVTESSVVSSDKVATEVEADTSGPSKKSGRKFVPISIDELKHKISSAQDAAAEKEGYDDPEEVLLTSLTSKIEKDLAKITFDSENVLYEGEGEGPKNPPLGYHTLESGLTFLGVKAGGDWEYPVFFIIYFDGSDLRAYIPKDGNVYNASKKQAYGNDDGEDIKDVKKRFKDRLTQDQLNGDLDINSVVSFDRKMLLQDINQRLVAA